jgi:hypothetical protein
MLRILVSPIWIVLGTVGVSVTVGVLVCVGNGPIVGVAVNVDVVVLVTNAVAVGVFVGVGLELLGSIVYEYLISPVKVLTYSTSALTGEMVTRR